MAVCLECGGALSERAFEGLCSKCLLEQGLRTVTTSTYSAAEVEPANILRDFGDYQLLEEIARGGMGVVYKARQKSLDRTVAVKTLALGAHASRDFVKRLRAEATVAAGLHHPNIVAIHEVGIRQDEHYLVMDFIDGPNLAQFMKSQPLAPGKAAQYLKAIAVAIHYAHEHGVLHRDLKPSNVLIDSEDQPRVTDFGLARRLVGDSSLTVSGQVLGSPGYMPPEQATATRHRVGRRSDVYSLGAMLYHMLTGRPPFVGEGLSQTLEQVLNRDAVQPRLLNPAVPRDLETICLKCLEKEPDRRYNTARELANDLSHFLSNEPILARPIGLSGKTWRWCRRKPALATLIVLLHVVGAVGLTGVLWQWRRAEIQGVELRRSLYASDMKLAQQALGANNLGRAHELLDKHRPGPGEEDLRGWEWRYLRQQCRNDASFTLCQKSNSIASLAVSHDSRWLAIGEDVGGHVSVWDLDTRQEVDHWQEGQSTALVAFSPREPLLACVNGRGVSGYFAAGFQSTAHLRNVAFKRSLGRFPLGGRCRRPILFSADGQSLFTSVNVYGVGNPILSWRIPDGLQTSSNFVHHGAGNPGPVWPFAVSHNLLACGVPGKILSMVDMATGKERWSQTNDDELVTVAFSPDASILASSSGLGYSLIRLWEVRSGKEIARLQGHRGWVSALVFWPDGKRLASASGDQTIRLWNLSDLPQVPPEQVLVGHNSEIWTLALLPDGRTLVSGSKDGSVCLWDTGQPTSKQYHVTLPIRVERWIFASDSKSVVTLDEQGHVARWSGTRFEYQEPVMTVDSNFWTCAFLGEGYLATVGEGAIRVWDLQRQEMLREFKSLGFPLGFLGQGRRSVVAYLRTNLLEEWDFTSGAKTASWQAGNEGNLIAFSPDERWCLGFRESGEASLRDMTTGREWHPALDVRRVTSVAYSPDGRIVAVASWLGWVKLWDALSLRELAILPGSLQGVYQVCFSPDSKRLVAGSDAKEAIKIWDVEGHRELLTLESEGSMFLPRFSPDGNMVGALNINGRNGLLHLWLAPSWEEIEAAERTSPKAEASR